MAVSFSFSQIRQLLLYNLFPDVDLSLLGTHNSSIPTPTTSKTQNKTAKEPNRTTLCCATRQNANDQCAGALTNLGEGKKERVHRREKPPAASQPSAVSRERLVKMLSASWRVAEKKKLVSSQPSGSAHLSFLAAWTQKPPTCPPGACQLVQRWMFKKKNAVAKPSDQMGS